MKFEDWDVSGVNKNLHKTFVRNEFQSLDDWIKPIRKDLRVFKTWLIVLGLIFCGAFVAVWLLF